ncbi:MAG: DUF2459 domain-containing protein [Gammaproteobacteria bacterium]|nr:DUF2459 domain-containing protein [Gammaproteobacteria bacterium]
MSFRMPLAVLLIASLCGCSATVVLPDPQDIETPRTVYVIEHGWHTSLVLTDADDAMLRFVYGDWHWYAQRRTGFWRAFGTLFSPTQGALGRQAMPAPSSPEAIRAHSRVAIDEIHSLTVAAMHVDALIERLESRFAATQDTLIYNEAYGLEFVQDPKAYTLGDNSNHVVTEWLEALDVEIRGSPIYGNWRFQSESR